MVFGKHSMIISILQGGLGNQMFQYAYGLACGKNNNRKLMLCFINSAFAIQRDYELSIFNIKNNIISPEILSSKYNYRIGKYSRVLQKIFAQLTKSPKHIFYQSNLQPFIPNISNSTNLLILDGYWQNENYFKPVHNLIRKQFIFKNFSDKKNLQIKKRIISSNSIFLHVRRTDFLSGTRTKKVHNVIPIDYYQKAVILAQTRIKNLKFFIFSDDIEWVKSNMTYLPGDSEFINHNKGDNSYQDMHLMSLCKSAIIANSSFSWWGAWLGDQKQVVYAPPKWTNKIHASDIVPKRWTVVT